LAILRGRFLVQPIKPLDPRWIPQVHFKRITQVGTVHTATALFFLFGCLIGMTILRKLGWALSRGILYTTAWPLCLFLLVAWGVGIAYGYRHVVLWLQLGWILKIVGYAIALYVSIPNYGLIAEGTVPGQAELRHMAVSQLSMLVFILCSAVFAFTLK
jgi:hypothetical protein